MATTTLRPEETRNVLGVPSRASAVIAADDGHILHQTVKASRTFITRGEEYIITAKLRFDDECRNGRESFSVTGEIRRLGSREPDTCGCIHEEIAKHFPEFAPLIPWHLTDTDGPMHYIENTVFLAGDRDPYGLRKGERRQLRDGKTCRVGEGKARELDAARRAAVWPEATDEELSQEPDALKATLLARLPALRERFKAAMISAGFVWPDVRAADRALGRV